MAHVSADRVRDTSTSTGTGAFVVSGTAPTAFRTFSAVLSTSDTFYYAIQHQTANEWEIGLGTYSSANTITRTTVYASSAGGSAVTFSSGTKDVFITLAAARTVQLDNNGNVGIGTNSPSQKLHVAGSASTYSRVSSSNAGTGAGAYYTNATATWLIGAGPVSGLSEFAFVDQTSGSLERARITSSGDFLLNSTTTSLTSGIGAKFINSATNPYMGYVVDGSTGVSTYHLYSTSAAAFRFYVGSDGTVYATNTTISAISDQRFKENVRDLDIGLAAVMALRPRKFDWKERKGKNIKNDRGFIAQEFEQVFPDLIDEWKDPSPEGEEPYKSVRQDLIPVLVKAIQELKDQNDELKARVTALESA